MEPMMMMSLIKQFGPQVMQLLGMGGGPSPGGGNAGPPPPQQTDGSKFALGIKEGMNIDAGAQPFAGAPFGLKEAGAGGGGDDNPYGNPMPPPEFEGEITVTGEDPGIAFTGPMQIGREGGGGEFGGGGGGGGPGGGGLPPWFQKLGMGANVGQALGQKAPAPPPLPGGGGFDMQNSLMQWLQSIGRR